MIMMMMMMMMTMKRPAVQWINLWWNLAGNNDIIHDTVQSVRLSLECRV